LDQLVLCKSLDRVANQTVYGGVLGTLVKGIRKYL